MIKELRLLRIEPDTIIQISQIFSVPNNKNFEAVLKWRLIFSFIHQAHFSSYLAQFFFECEMFQIKVVDARKTHISCTKLLFKKKCRS